jgi:tetratricopeptide (TPR) repeat protein
MADNISYEAKRRLEQAEAEYHNGQPNRAIELLDEIVDLAKSYEPLRDEYTYLAALIDLYKIHRTLGHNREASEYFDKAVSLGADADKLRAD